MYTMQLAPTKEKNPVMTGTTANATCWERVKEASANVDEADEDISL